MLVEPDPTGHRMVLYARSIAREALQRGWRLRLLTTAAARRHSAYAALAAELGSAMPAHAMPDAPLPERSSPSALFRYQLNLHRAAGEGYRHASATSGEPDLVFLNSLDPLEKVLAVRGSPFGSARFAGMSISPRFHHDCEGVNTPRRRTDLLHAWAFRRVLGIPTLRALTVIDPTLPAAAERGRWSGREKLRWVPDPGAVSGGFERPDARAHAGVPPDAFVILLYGGISERKGLRALLSALEAPRTPRHVVALVVGQVYEDGQAVLSGPEATRLRDQGRLFEVRGFVDQERSAWAFRASDAVWLAYEGFYGTSAVLVQAGAAGLPVLARDEGLVGWLVRRHRLGLIIEGDESVGATIARMASDSALRETAGANGLEFARERTPERFGGAVCDALAEAARAAS